MKNLTTVMGPGCGNADLEHCPPTFHFELTGAELLAAMNDPAALASKLGVAQVDHVLVSTAPPSQRPGPTVDGIPTTREADDAETVYCCISCLSHSVCCRPWPAGSIG